MASQRAEKIVLFTYRFSALLYISLGVLLLLLIEFGILFLIDGVHRGKF